jgi:hypothetical protein
MHLYIITISAQNAPLYCNLSRHYSTIHIGHISAGKGWNHLSLKRIMHSFMFSPVLDNWMWRLSV